MGLFDKVERGLERTINRTFAKAFKSEVQPVEIASAIRRAMDDRASVLGPGRTMVPNVYTIELSTTDHERLAEWAESIVDDLVAAAQEHAETSHYVPGGPIGVVLAEGGDLETGVFRVRPSIGTTPGMPPAPRPQHRPVPPVAAPERAHPDPAGERIGADLTGLDQAPPRMPPVNPAHRPWLDIDGERYPLIGSLTVIGRDATADVILDDPGISRRHSEVRITHDGPHLVASIRDLASTNGTFVNGERITSTRLGDGDRVTVGRTTMQYRAGRR